MLGKCLTYFHEQVCIPGLHLSLGIFNRLWTLLEEQCKALDFSLDIEGAGSARSFHTAGAGALQKRTELMLQLETDTKCTELLSDLLTYTTLTVEDFSSNSFYTSTKEEMDATRRRITDTVHLQSPVHISITLILQYYRNPRLLSLTRSSRKR